MTDQNSRFILVNSIIFCLSLVSTSLVAQQMVYSSGKDSWNPDSLGNHRAVVQFTGKGNIAMAEINWRRRDADPGQKRIIVQDAKTGKKITNVQTGDISREKGTVYFEPVSGAGTYYIYYMPYIYEGPNTYYPKGVYRKPENTADVNWLTGIATVRGPNSDCVVKEIQSINEFNSYFPMEVIATAAETKNLIEKYRGEAFLIFPEYRTHSIRMRNDLPQRWINRGVQNSFSDIAQRGEYLTFQLGIYALEDLKDVTISFTGLKNNSGKIIPAKNMSCINTDGVKYDAAVFTNKVDVPVGKVQAMWCGIDVPQSALPSNYTGKAIVRSGNATKEIELMIKVSGGITKNGGIDKPENMARLKWLNSTLAQENTVIAPYTPLLVKENVISFLGRKLILNKDGFPAQIQTYFTPEMTSIGTTPNDLFTEPVHFQFYDTAGKQTLLWKTNGIHYLKKEPGTVSWQSTGTSSALQMDVNGVLEFDGFLSYTVKYTALRDVTFSEINFHLPMQPAAAKYMMGLGLKGGLRPDTLQWKWDVARKNQDGAWIGNVNAGLQFSLRDEKYNRPLNTNFYLQKPLLLPASWGNENKGGVDVFQKGKTVLVNAYSGSRNMKKGDVLYYNFNLLVTPFHPINTEFQWDSRFYHRYKEIDTIRQTGATIVNIHHATPINPYINYPFIEFTKMKDYIDEAHEKGLKVKIYNTIRELSNKAYEIHALRSLGHEIFSGGKGGGFSWLQEHLGDDYIAAWFVPELKDAAIVNSGMNRWHNYYVEGMNWLVQNVGIDGVYLDDVAFDRITMKRIKRVLTQNGHPGILDLHSANQFNKNDGFNNSANLYMEHFPYLNKLWFGEYFDYEKNKPDFFLTEISGIPFGLMGEMLQDGGNAWRGMIYGMTNRMPWSENADPRPIWKLWDEFGIRGSEMIGYWSENCPVKTSNDKVLATVYKKNGSALISIASWADEDVNVNLQIDWNRLGIDPSHAKLVAPAVKNFQTGSIFSVNDALPIAKGRGWLLIIK
jgi:hypothetical protein